MPLDSLAADRCPWRPEDCHAADDSVDGPNEPASGVTPNVLYTDGVFVTIGWIEVVGGGVAPRLIADRF
jgi:hypothetical protein